MPTVFRNGLLYLGNGRFERGSLAVHAGRIAAVALGADELRAEKQSAELDLSGADVIDLEGGTLLPGFQDAHVHPLFAGSSLLGIDLSEVHDGAEYLRIIAAYSAAHPDDEVLEGACWFGDVFEDGFPRADLLDAVVPDRPIVLISHDFHGAWVNTVALDRAGITRATPDPADGRILRDADGTPTGMLIDGAVGLLSAILPDRTAEFSRRALLAAQHRMHAAGITAWQDAAVGESDLGPDAFPVYEGLARAGELTGRVVAALWWDRSRGVEQLDDLLERRERARQTGWFDAGTVKVMQDGMVENGTAALLDPYCGRGEDRGIAFLEPDVLAELSRRLDALDFQIHYHAVGDRAVRDCLDAVAATRAANGARGNRHHIAHLDLVDPADAPRFAELDVSANVTALWARRDEEILTRKLPLLGADRERRHFPFQSLHAAGARLVGGSDWPVTDPNPLWAVYTAVTRTAPREDVHAVGADACTVPLEPAEALDYGTALDAYLTGAAYVNRLEREAGHLAPGLAADLVWLDRDIRSVDALGAARVRQTWVGGASVYAAT